MLPAVYDDEDWDAVVPNEAIIRPGAVDILRRMGLAEQSLDRYGTGSMPTYAVGASRVLKLYPTVCAGSAAIEARVLEHLHGKLPVPTPELLAEGEYGEGWRYVLMSQLAGQSLATAWPQIPGAARDRLAETLGQMLATMHDLDIVGLDASIGPTDWHAFVAEQRATAVERQRARGLPEAWLEQIPDFLAAQPLRDGDEHALLHTEVMREHLLIDPRTWTLTGLFDFEPAMIGGAAYEFAAVGVFTARGDTRFLGRIMTAYGKELTPTALLAQVLIHVESNLLWYLSILPAPHEDTLEAMAATWFATA
ncbi:aminoglycoside 3'-phosphotransferase/choline kinase family protein [Glycomyces luteolus]|uniref:Aminoglycoside 3'-phosphotransferase/choline kinase family protein n=1 Tax=Glycomyces luteolus TaxID=2670330 RepID=A0A9X3P4T0_9ACTN|nr:aminoglycoside 3'-phosphotransferase/choline kinase family protein [Glycomyces luteolus]MDA1358641.1 aminoglycoside 3'-phosphotransferase/choline kinase family protein [Glycomyces luteolus]